MKGFALGSALLSMELFERLAQADTPAMTASTESIVATGKGVTIQQMMVQPLPTAGNRIAAMVTVEYEPAAASPPHRHPGPVFGYVLQGQVIISIDQHSPITYSAGDVWYEEPRHTHRTSANASTTEPAKILAFLLIEKGQSLLEVIKGPA